ncbi:prepilin-type N-terminal cleavage/methylation domain-containing protein, partial [Janthinobacterium sp. CG_23.3]|uniref:PilW family protein n=1 Tax=Janthinobacterium sp. CG_23.3 TaxID=3349634 RepID=UPI0038D35DD9
MKHLYPALPALAERRHHGGFSLVELMVSVTISLLILVALSAMFINVSRSNNEMIKSNSQIENGRFAVQLLENDLVHAGFWSQFVPQFDDVNWTGVPNDTPDVVPDPCLAHNAGNWNFSYIQSLIGIPVQSGDAAPGTCVLGSKRANTDVLVVRHAATCAPGEANCDADTTGKLYFQNSLWGGGTTGAEQGRGTKNPTTAPALHSQTTKKGANSKTS